MKDQEVSDEDLMEFVHDFEDIVCYEHRCNGKQHLQLKLFFISIIKEEKKSWAPNSSAGRALQGLLKKVETL